MRSPKVWAIIIGLVVILAAGFFLAPAPLLPVSLQAEPVFTVLGFTVTNTMMSAWLTILFWLVVGIVLRRNMQLVPHGIQNFFEAIVEFVYSYVEGFVGRDNVKQFFPLCAAIFLFIVTSNWFGLLPGFSTIGTVHFAEADHSDEAKEVLVVPANISGVPFAYIPLFGRLAKAPGGEAEASTVKAAEFRPWFRSANSDLNTTVALALIAFVCIEYWGIRSAGFGTYMTKFINLRQGPIYFAVGLIEILSELARIISFSFRLFGNVFAGEILLAVMVFLIPWAVVLPFYGLELFFGMLQGAIFAILVLAFGMEAISHHAESHAAEPAVAHGTAPVAAHH